MLCLYGSVVLGVNYWLCCILASVLVFVCLPIWVCFICYCLLFDSVDFCLCWLVRFANCCVIVLWFSDSSLLILSVSSVCLFIVFVCLCCFGGFALVWFGLVVIAYLICMVWLCEFGLGYVWCLVASCCGWLFCLLFGLNECFVYCVGCVDLML